EFGPTIVATDRRTARTCREKPLSIALREINAGLLTSEAIEGPAQ
ncbi:DNA-directed RNA polymerase subunit omega, partial [Streptomyces zhihengii]